MDSISSLSQSPIALTIGVNLVRIMCQSAIVLVVWDAVIIVIVVTRISLAVLVVIGLIGVGDVRAVVQVVLVSVLINVLVAVTLVSHTVVI